MAYLYISKFYALFLGHYFDNSEHKHHALQLCKGIETDLKMSINGRVLSENSFLIAPNCPHKVTAGGSGNLFLLFLDPDTVMGQKIMDRYLKSEPYIPFDYPQISEVIQEPISKKKIELLLENLFKDEITKHPFDPRITKVLGLIENNPLKKVKVPFLAEQIHLSESRLQHLFKKDIGIPIKRYLLWKRIGSAIELLQETSDLTTVAHDAGFADSAHFSRTFKDMFGVRLKELFKTAGKIQIVYIP